MTDLTTSAPADDTAVDDATTSFLRADAIVSAINAAIPGTLAPIPKEYLFKKRDAGVVSLALNSAFECLGGLPRLVAVASEDPKWFYGIWSRQLGMENAGLTQNATTIIYNSGLPSSPLNSTTINERGEVFTAETQPVDPDADFDGDD